MYILGGKVYDTPNLFSLSLQDIHFIGELINSSNLQIIARGHSLRHLKLALYRLDEPHAHAMPNDRSARAAVTNERRSSGHVARADE